MLTTWLKCALWGTKFSPTLCQWGGRGRSLYYWINDLTVTSSCFCWFPSSLKSATHILFNYICPNRIFVSSKLICPSTYKPTQPDITPCTQPIMAKYPFQYAVQVIWSKIHCIDRLQVISLKFLFVLLSSKFANNLPHMSSYWLDTRACGREGRGVNFFFLHYNLQLYVVSSHLDGKFSSLGEVQIHFLNLPFCK